MQEALKFVLGYIARHGDVNESRQAIQYVESLKQFDVELPVASEVKEPVKESADA